MSLQVTPKPAPESPPADAKQLKDLKRACEQFEAVFAKQLLTEMRKSVKETSLGGDQTGTEIYKDMMDQAIADSMAHQGALGIGKLLYKEFEKAVSAEVHPAAAALTTQTKSSIVAPSQEDARPKHSEGDK